MFSLCIYHMVTHKVVRTCYKVTGSSLSFNLKQRKKEKGKKFFLTSVFCCLKCGGKYDQNIMRELTLFSIPWASVHGSFQLQGYRSYRAEDCHDYDHSTSRNHSRICIREATINVFFAASLNNWIQFHCNQMFTIVELNCNCGTFTVIIVQK